MINLIKAEATRWRSRRLLWVMALVTLVAFAGLATMVFFLSKAPSAAQAAESEAAYQQEFEAWEQNHEADEQACLASSSPEEQEFCTWEKPTREQFTYQLIVQEVVPAMPIGGGAVLALVGFMISASYIGAEMSSGAIANWLTFNPSRWKVMVSKLVVALLGTALFATIFMAIGLIAVAIINAINATGEDPLKWAPLLQQSGRVVALAVIVAAIGFGVALIARHTAAALGALGAFFVARIVIGAFGGSPKMAALQPWLPDNNALAFLLNDYRYLVQTETMTPQGISYDSVEQVLSFEHGLVYLLVCFAIAVIAAFLVFQRRDVN